MKTSPANGGQLEQISEPLGETKVIKEVLQIETAEKHRRIAFTTKLRERGSSGERGGRRGSEMQIGRTGVDHNALAPILL